MLSIIKSNEETEYDEKAITTYQEHFGTFGKMLH